MKFKKALFYLFLAISVSCSKSEIDSPIVGTWEAISFVTSVPVDENDDGIKNSDLKKEVDCIAMEVDFQGDGEVIFISSHMTYDISIENGNVIVTPKGCTPETEKGYWTTNDFFTKLYIDFIFEETSESNTIEIDLELSDNYLTMKDMIYEEGDNPITYTIEFRKI